MPTVEVETRAVAAAGLVESIVHFEHLSWAKLRAHTRTFLSHCGSLLRRTLPGWVSARPGHRERGSLAVRLAGRLHRRPSVLAPGRLHHRLPDVLLGMQDQDVQLGREEAGQGDRGRQTAKKGLACGAI